jgi:hypothetical protein
MKTIGYFGDSFCESQEKDSWCVLLADKLKCEVKHWGRGGSSVWSVFLDYQRLLHNDALPDVCVFCYTEPYRLYHPTVPLAYGVQPFPGPDENLWKAADMYYVYLQDRKKDELAYRYALQWFDQNELPRAKDKKIVQMWSIRPFELAGYPGNIKLQTGTFIDESILRHACDGETKPKLGKFDPDLSNHMTPEQNRTWADIIYDKIS